MPKDKSSGSNDKIPLICKKTGGKIDDVVYRLLKHGSDDDMDVQNEIFQSLSIIGKQQPLFVVTQGVDFINKDNPKTAHRARIISLTASIIEEETCGDDKDELLSSECDLPKHIIKFATLQMTTMKNQPQVQNNAVKLLVALSYQNCEAVVDSILQYFKTGQIPSYYVLKSLADTAKSNPIPFTAKLSEIFTKITPILAMVKKPDHIQIFTLGIHFKYIYHYILALIFILQSVFCFECVFNVALGRFAEAILKTQEEKEEEILRKRDEQKSVDADESNPFKGDLDEEKKQTDTVKAQMTFEFTEFAVNCAAAFDVVFTNWRKQSNVTIKLAVAESIGLLTEVMSKKKFAQRFIEILSYFAGIILSYIIYIYIYIFTVFDWIFFFFVFK